MHIVVHDQLSQIDETQWNALVDDNNPFLRHEFLNGLEVTGCVCEAKGWKPQHIAIYSVEHSDEKNAHSQLLAAMPCYLKEHSYGEYIFDWAWVNAYHRNGLEYYPKLSNAVPFTPATGPRLLLHPEAMHFQLTHETLVTALMNKVTAMTEDLGLSSFHSLFNTKQQAESLQEHGLIKRLSTQFHWQNRDYCDFNAFLASMSSKKRKNIKRERRRVVETGIHYRWLKDDQLSVEAAHQMHHFYSRTIEFYGAQSYLNLDFFEFVCSHFKHQTLFLFAEFEGQTIAGGMYFRGNNTLYGRYWGALANFHSIHFETCYYQPIDWCIEHGYQRFEAGAQGEHKLARGLEPNTTYSSHWISHPDFRNAITDFVESEQEHIHDYQQAMSQHSPFRKPEL